MLDHPEGVGQAGGDGGFDYHGIAGGSGGELGVQLGKVVIQQLLPGVEIVGVLADGRFKGGGLLGGHGPGRGFTVAVFLLTRGEAGTAFAILAGLLFRLRHQRGVGLLAAGGDQEDGGGAGYGHGGFAAA